jgi:ArsR family transcriptional regulator, nickel/cobalt-responsive transcriptional repressor
MSHGIEGRAPRPDFDATTAPAIAECLGALAAPTRLLILGRLRDGAAPVGELARALDMEPSAISHQLRLLRHLGLVVRERVGRQVYYGLHDSHVAALLDQAVFHIQHLRLSAPEPLDLDSAARAS